MAIYGGGRRQEPEADADRIPHSDDEISPPGSVFSCVFWPCPSGGAGEGGLTLGMCGGGPGHTRGDVFHAPQGKFEYLRRDSREETHDEKNEALPVV